MAACVDTGYVLTKLDWMRERHIWPNGLRYLWTDAFGVTAAGGEHIRFSETHSQGVGQLGTELPPRPGDQDSLIVHRGSVKRSPLEASSRVVLQS